jgi:phosphonate transport system permease protein
LGALYSGSQPMTISLSPSLAETVTRSFDRKRRLAFAIPAAILAYLIYAAISFDLAGLVSRARFDNAAILLSDFWSHKTHVTRDNRTGKVTVAIEGEAKGTYPAGKLPDWVRLEGAVTSIDLGQGHVVTYDDQGARYVVPGYGTIDIRPEGGKPVLIAPEPIPDWISVAENKVSVTTDAGRFSYSRAKVETFRYQAGWELFFFTLDSPFHGKSFAELFALATTGDRIDPARANLVFMAGEFWTNRMWRHGDVAWAIFETVLMAFLGTMTAALVALPLGFLAARNFTPLGPLRFAARRVFDFLRGVDGLIWTIILSRAFGPGPMTGAIAIALTDTGTFGKTFSEALENIDEKQAEGIRSTGATSLQRARFGVIPQIMPVILSQVLYYLESNTRSATVIGAIVGGGIGLLLTQAIITQKDWEEVAYYMVLIVLMVMLMDTLSGWLRRRLIRGTGAGKS